MEKSIWVKEDLHYELSKIKLAMKVRSFDEALRRIIKACDGKLYKENKPNETMFKKSNQTKTRV
jgi:predicted CopG family antitoxin